MVRHFRTQHSPVPEGVAAINNLPPSRSLFQRLHDVPVSWRTKPHRAGDDLLDGHQCLKFLETRHQLFIALREGETGQRIHSMRAQIRLYYETDRITGAAIDEQVVFPATE